MILTKTQFFDLRAISTKMIKWWKIYVEDEWMLESLFMQTSIEGGSNDNDVTDETVIAWFSLVSSLYVDTTHTG